MKNEKKTHCQVSSRPFYIYKFKDIWIYVQVYDVSRKKRMDLCHVIFGQTILQASLTSPRQSS